MVDKKLIVFVLVAAAAGLLIGGLIGHFATKKPEAQTATTTQSPGPPGDWVNPNEKNEEKDRQNREFLFGKVDPERLREVEREFTSSPHLAGSDRNNELGDKIYDTWQSYNFEVKKDRYEILLSYPGNETGRMNKAQILDSSGGVEYDGKTVEDNLANETSPLVPPFNGYAKGGIVESDTVYYVNYCRDEDFKYLQDVKTINVSGSIVICRYGEIFRGNKVIFAEQYGALGVMIYNDPVENVDLSRLNATSEDTFPNSWFLPPSGVERGSVMEFSGDPLTPGFPSKDYALRKTVEQVRKEKIIPNIPTQPIAYGEMKLYFEHLSGVEVDRDDWKGKLDVTFRYGGILAGGRKYKILNYNTDDMKNITNVFGIIRGSEEPDRYVLMGNHRDAWMNGATDAVSGTTTMMETSRVFSELMKTGWRPRRSIVFCSWDGEEYGIIGSIEWLDDVKVLLGARAVAYMNCDSGVVWNQVLKAAASPLMFKLMYDTANLVKLANATDPSRTMYDEWLQRSGNMSLPNPKPHIGDLGSGSDHTGFYHRHGITSMDAVYYYDKKEIPISAYYPLYHTSYDSFLNVERFVDPTFSFHKMLTQFFTELLRNTADSVMIPFITNDYAIRLKEVKIGLDNAVRDKLATKNLQGSLVDLDNSINKFQETAIEFDKAVAAVNDKTSWSEVRRLNDQLFHLERAFLYDLGILTRKYIKHVVFAPSATDSYASAAFPGISDALYEIEDNDEAAWDKVREELTKAVYTIESATKAITVNHII